MSPMITNLLLIFLGLFAVVIVIELVVSRAVKRFFIQAVILLGVFLLLKWTTGFPSAPSGAIPFGYRGFSPDLAVVVMFACTLLGIVAHYVFFIKGKFSWNTLLKPMVISPIVLLPLIGTLAESTNVQTIQLVSFGFLAFQNGFFWKEVLQRAKSQI